MKAASATTGTFRNTDLLRLKVFDKGKTKQWYEDITSYYLPPYNRLYSEDYKEGKALYEFYNNDLRSFEKDINRLCNDTINFGGQMEELLPYNKMRNKFEILVGDLLARGLSQEVILMSARAIHAKNDQLLQALQDSVNEDLRLALQAFQEQMTTMPERELQQFIQQKRGSITPKDLNFTTFTSQLEDYKRKMLRYTYQEQDILHKQIGTFKDTFIWDRAFIYPGWSHGRPKIEIRNPLFCGWHKSPNIPFVQHSDHFWHNDSISIGEALDLYINKLSKEGLERLLSYSSYYNQQLSPDHLNKFVFDHTNYYAVADALGDKFIKDFSIGLHQGDSRHYPGRNDKIRRTHLEFKAYKPTLIFTSKDEYNRPVTAFLEENADVIPPNAHKVKYTNEWQEEGTKYIWEDRRGNEFQARVLWIPRRYESTRLGTEDQVDQREVPFQPDYVLRPFSAFELSTKGGIVNSRNAKSLSLMQNGMPYAFQIMAAKAIQNREMAKYRGFEIHQDLHQIPTDLGINEEGNPDAAKDAIYRNEVIARKTGVRYYESGKRQAGSPLPGNRPTGISVAQLGSSQELVNLQSYIDLLDRELGMAIGVPPSREGQVTPYSNVTDNQQNLVQSTLQTALYNYWTNRVWSSALNEHLTNMDTFFQKWFEDNPDEDHYLLEYMVPGGKELIKIMPEDLNHEDVGLFLGNSESDDRYLQYLLANLQPIAQNAGEGAVMLSSILRSIASKESPEEIHKMIQVAEAEQQERLQQQQQLEAERAAQLLEEQKQYDVFKANLQVDAAVQVEREKRITEISKEEIAAQRFALQHDIDKDNVSDKIQVAEIEARSKEKIAAENRKVDREKIQADKKKNITTK